jgi:predicted HicB family RNase H-like nuclease
MPNKLIPPEKRLTLRMTGPEHARLARAARRRGLDLQSWALARLQVAAGAELDESATPPTPS